MAGNAATCREHRPVSRKPIAAICVYIARDNYISNRADVLMTDRSIEAQRAVATELVALTLLADGVLASRELEAMDRHGIPQLLGVSRDALIQAVIDHCRKLLQRPERIDPMRMVDIERFETMVDRIDDPDLRETVCRVMLVLAKADGVICQPEQTLLRDVLTRWGIPLERLRD